MAPKEQKGGSVPGLVFLKDGRWIDGLSVKAAS